MRSFELKAEPDRATRSGSAEPRQVRIWDPFVRIFHWTLVASFVVAWVSGDEFERLHIAVGYLLAGLVATRVIWGFIGSRHARFSDFLYKPTAILTFLKDTARMRATRYLGHNPAGGIMVIALLVMLIAISATGYLMTTDAFWGVEWVENAHKSVVYLTGAMVAVHVAGVAFASIEHGENLVKSMFTGRKQA